MKVLKFPIAVWEDADGCYTAGTLNGEPAVAVDVTHTGAIAQLKNYLRWHVRRDTGVDEPDMSDLSMVDVHISTRPQYATEHSVFPCSQSIRVRVPVIFGRRTDHSVVCSAPTVGVHLSCPSASVLEELAREAIGRKLSGLTPAELAKMLPPKRIALDSLNIKWKPASEDRQEDDFPTVRAVADPLGDRAMRKRYGRAWRRDREIAALVEQLDKKRTNLILLGENGCGKTTLLANAARQLERRTPKGASTRRRFWLTSGTRLIAGMQYLGQWEERFERVIDELSEMDGVLCADSLLELVRHGGAEPSAGIAAFLTPYLANGELQLIGEATSAELDMCRRLVPNFVSLFQVFRVDPLGPDDAQAVLNDLIVHAARNRRVEVADGVAQQTYSLFKRFMPYQPFPGRTTVFLNELLEQASQRPITQQDVHSRFQRFTGLPDRLLRDDVPLEHHEVLASLERDIFGQRQACEAAAAVVTRFKAGLNDPHRPLGVLMFCGPTGVGKTQLAKTLAKYLFGSGDSSSRRLVQLDMSEYSGYGAADRLTMRPDGRPSKLIQQIRLQPFVVLLLDEIEKASAEVFDVLLSVLDEGRLTDRYGRTTMFRSAVVIMTTNLGAACGRPLGFGPATTRYEREVADAFRPEFFNRIDQVVSFDPLARETVLAIARKELVELAEREGLAGANLKLEYSDALLGYLAEEGFDSRLGARPLQRVIEGRLVAPLAQWVVEHPGVRDRTIQVDVQDGEIVVQ